MKKTPIVNDYFEHLNVPLPHEHRLIEASFARSGQAGDRLMISDPRIGAKVRGRHERWFQMSEQRVVVETERPSSATGSE